MRYDPSHFELDGALRDVLILDIGIHEWRLMISSLPALDAEVVLTVDDAPVADASVSDPADLFALLEGDEDASATLAVKVGEMIFRCYFYRVREMEFTFDPRTVRNPGEFVSLERFMKWLGESCHRRVVMVMEGVGGESVPPLLEYVPHD
ncbi:hypothetical protein [Streptomyces sp. NPDC002690]